ncbi:hypothetical protein [Rossellomorea marisflavi]|uniref:hypothetical protein n=1 Tax=Rossellomorea marisflavi TaxID=189381 RepID=UPI00115169DF|nr:hypothetical protein [Rossellomorea marisflavi]
MKRRLSALDEDQWGMKSVPFRYDRPLSSGSQLSRFGCACRVSILPLFPKESAGLRYIALCGGGS